MKEKVLTLLTLIFIALSISGFTYAQWNDTIVVSNTMTFDYWNDSLNMGFVNPLICWDDETTKDVGKFNCYYTDLKTDSVTAKQANETLIITTTNAYPGYKVHCNFTVENIGTLPLHINETGISDDTGGLTFTGNGTSADPWIGIDANGNPIFNITITPEVVCNNLSSGETLEFELTICITQNVEECHTYSFQVKIMYEQGT